MRARSHFGGAPATANGSGVLLLAIGAALGRFALEVDLRRSSDFDLPQAAFDSTLSLTGPAGEARWLGLCGRPVWRGAIHESSVLRLLLRL